MLRRVLASRVSKSADKLGEVGAGQRRVISVNKSTVPLASMTKMDWGGERTIGVKLLASAVNAKYGEPGGDEVNLPTAL